MGKRVVWVRGGVGKGDGGFSRAACDLYGMCKLRGDSGVEKVVYEIVSVEVL